MSVEVCASCLSNGDVCVLPTETVYGLAGSAISSNAIKKIYKIKGRPPNNPLIVHVLDHESAFDFCHTNNVSKILADAFWPGPLTFILPKKDIISNSVTAGLDTVAVRSPAHPLFRKVLEKVEFPIAAPSANLSTQISPTSKRDVLDAMGKNCPYILDGGTCNFGIESTVIDLTDSPVKILRHGPISASEIESKTGIKVNFPDSQEKSPTNEPQLNSPGQMSKHYAPTTPLRLFKSFDDLSNFHLNKKNDLIILPSNKTNLPVSLQKVQIFYLSKTGEFRDIAQNLFRVLREADKIRKNFINTHLLPEEEKYSAINDKLIRASSINI
tara:strand:+ start:231 stop:1211 length:981 start_codon:yes stop_codon:yes gene_type:complete